MLQHPTGHKPCSSAACAVVASQMARGLVATWCRCQCQRCGRRAQGAPPSPPATAQQHPNTAAQGLTEQAAAERYARVDVYVSAFRPLHAKICARPGRPCKEEGAGSVAGAGFPSELLLQVAHLPVGGGVVRVLK